MNANGFKGKLRKMVKQHSIGKCEKNAEKGGAPSVVCCSKKFTLRLRKGVVLRNGISLSMPPML